MCICFTALLFIWWDILPTRSDRIFPFQKKVKGRRREKRCTPQESLITWLLSSENTFCVSLLFNLLVFFLASFIDCRSSREKHDTKLTNRSSSWSDSSRHISVGREKEHKTLDHLNPMCLTLFSTVFIHSWLIKRVSSFMLNRLENREPHHIFLFRSWNDDVVWLKPKDASEKTQKEEEQERFDPIWGMLFFMRGHQVIDNSGSTVFFRLSLSLSLVWWTTWTSCHNSSLMSANSYFIKGKRSSIHWKPRLLKYHYIPGRLLLSCGSQRREKYFIVSRRRWWRRTPSLSCTGDLVCCSGCLSLAFWIWSLSDD